MRHYFLLVGIFAVVFKLDKCFSKGSKQRLTIYSAGKRGDDSNESNEKQHTIVKSGIVPPIGVTSFSELQLEEDIAEESKKRQIISGWNVSRTIAPYMGLLVTNRSITCGSSLITRNILLTAAHCVYFATRVEVFIGGIDRFKLETSEQLIRINRTIWHELYNEITLENDIALAFLNTSAVINQFVSTIRLPRRSDISRTFLRNDVKACGYGLTSDNGTFSNFLLCVDLIVYSNRDCMRYFMPSLIRNYTLCTQPSTKSICRGDSGGPLIIRENNVDTLIGVVSFVAALRCTGFPNGFMRVTSFLDWIAKNGRIDIP